MPRDANGNYTLPAGNPVVSGEVVAASWANNTMNDLGTEMGLSLDRQGRGGMLAPFRHADGTVGGPAITFTNEPTTGLYRAGAADLRVSIAGTQRMRWTSSGAEIWDPVGSAWINLGTTLASLQTSITTNTTDIDAIEAREANYAKTNAQNIFNTHQLIQNASGTWNVYKDSPTAPSKATRFGLLSDYTKLEHYDGANWYPVVVSNALETWLQGDALVLATKGGTQMNVVGSAEFRHYYGQAAVFYNAAQTKSSSLLQFNNDFFFTSVTGQKFYWQIGGANVAWMQEGGLTLNDGHATIMLGSYSGFSQSGDGVRSPVVRDNGGLRGGVIYWSDAGYRNGRINISTSLPSASGYQTGDIILVYEGPV